jgi:hypothetical protein
MKMQTQWIGVVSVDDKFGRHITLDNEEVREFITRIAREKPEMVREAMGWIR